MKKIWFSLIVIILSVILFACPGSQDDALDGQEDETTHTSLSSHLLKKQTHDLDDLMKQKYIRVLTTFNRTNFFISDATPHGFEYELMKNFEKFLNKGKSRKKLKVVIEFIPCSRDMLLPKLIEGYGDIAAAGLTITPERSKLADFTDPYLKGIDQVVVINKHTETLKTINDISGREIFIRKSSSYFEALNRFNQRLRKKKKKPAILVHADENLETEDILELVNTGVVDMTICDSHLAEAWSDVFKDISVLKDVKIQSDDNIAWMVRKKNPLLKAKLNEFLKNHKQGTLMGNIFFNRYYKNSDWIKNPLTSINENRDRECFDLIGKYARKYRFDARLIMALAYQESGLDNSKKSAAGAMGIMQIKPETAADKNIGIQNIDKLENNIHAGIKYLAFLRDRYFSAPEILPRDQVRFAMAAYNAGPAKMRRARDLTLKMGLDSNKWFRNVELAMLQLVGQETVRYVSNINKYYIIYGNSEKYLKKRENSKADISND